MTSFTQESCFISGMFDLIKIKYVFFVSVISYLESLGGCNIVSLFFGISLWYLPYTEKILNVDGCGNFPFQQSLEWLMLLCGHCVVMVCPGFFKALISEVPICWLHIISWVLLCPGHHLSEFHSLTPFGFLNCSFCYYVVRYLRLGLHMEVFPEAVLLMLNVIFLVQKRWLKNISLFLPLFYFSPRIKKKKK